MRALGQSMRGASVALVVGATAALGAAPGAAAATHGRHHAGATTRTLRIAAQDSATSPLADSHPRFSLSLRHGQTVAAGLVELQFSNHSRMMQHQAQLARLHPGVSVSHFLATARQAGDNAAMALVDVAGGADTIAPGGRQTTWQWLVPGRYVVLCLVDDPDGKSHLDLGMISSFRVTGAPSGRKHPRGHVAGTITARTQGSKMSFKLPRHFTGNGLYRFVNAKGDDLHELSIVRLAPGSTRQDVIDWFTHPGPPPFTGAGGFGAVAPHQGGWLRLHLKPGRYVATCFIPDDMPPHMPHGAMGMDLAFTIK